eukprot:scaffold653_cov68-Phaeocystis_antarctica.AAC.1
MVNFQPGAVRKLGPVVRPAGSSGRAEAERRPCIELDQGTLAAAQPCETQVEAAVMAGAEQRSVAARSWRRDSCGRTATATATVQCATHSRASTAPCAGTAVSRRRCVAPEAPTIKNRARCITIVLCSGVETVGWVHQGVTDPPNNCYNRASSSRDSLVTTPLSDCNTRAAIGTMKLAMLLVSVHFLATAVEARPGGSSRQLGKHKNIPNAIATVGSARLPTVTAST